tara:strand:- start:591 stop:839 length:249 start_codon:yes stop_codon:yes gene_type:complete
LSIVSKLKKVLKMGFKSSNLSIKNPPKVTPPKPDVNQLTGKEIEVLLKVVAESTFKGADIEPIYNLVIKLQNQYQVQFKKDK